MCAAFLGIALLGTLSLFAQARTMPVPVAIPRASAGQAPAWSSPPKLVVGIVVDQMRVDYIYRYWDNFGEGGFKRLVQQGAFLRDAHYTYVPTVTGPGHASIWTGSTPSLHGIVANERYDRDTRKMIYCAADTSVIAVGGTGPIGQRSPQQLLATTLADEIERRTDRRSHTVGIALKDRSAIMPIGRTGDEAFWFDPASGSFITSTWYMKQLPKWVQDFNARKLPEHYLDQTWNALLPIERYHQVLPDDNPYEAPLAAGLRPAFPYKLDSLRKAGVGLDLIAYTPWGNTLTTDMALAAIDGEHLGADAITDVLAISYSSTDILGHKLGPRAVEIEDMYIRLDQEIARLLGELDTKVGAGKYTLFLTADHGVVDVPQYMKDLKGSAGYVDMKPIVQELNMLFGATEDSVAFIGEGQVFMTNRKGSSNGAFIFPKQNVIDYLLKLPGVASAWIASSFCENSTNGTDQYSLMKNGFMPQRCGDILYLLRPGYFEKDPATPNKGTTHGSGWNYDTHVPVLFYGQGIAHGEVVRRTAIADIVPTITMIVGCALPDAAVGEPVPEVMAK